MSAQPPPNPLDEIKSGLQESPPHEEFKAGLADKQPLLQNNQPRYAFGWFDKWLLIIPAALLLILLALAWVSCNPAPTATVPPTAPTASAAANTISLHAPSSGTTAAIGETITLSGQAPPGSAVQLLNRGKLISTTTADANSYYEFGLSAAQPGEYELQTVTTINGQQVTSPTVVITVTGPAANATAVAAAETPGAGGAIDTNATAAARATLDMQAAQDATAAANANATPQPGATSIAIATADTNATNGANATTETSATTEANATTETSATSAPGETAEPNTTPTLNETPGAEATAQAGTAGGANQTAEANATATTETQSTDSTPGAVATPTSDSAGGAMNGANLNPPTVNIGINALVAVGTMLTGTAAPNTRVVIYFNEQEIGSADVDAKGIWQFTLPDTLPPGEYAIVVVITDASGKKLGSASDKQTITVIAKPLLPVTGGEFK